MIRCKCGATVAGCWLQFDHCPKCDRVLSRSKSHWLLWLAVVMFVLLPVLLAFASDPRAEASVAVSVSRVRVAQQKHAVLPNDFKQSTGVDPRDYSEALHQITMLEADNADLRKEKAHAFAEAKAAEEKLASLRDGAGKSERKDAATEGSAEKQPDAEWTRPPVLLFDKPVASSAMVYEVTMFTAEDEIGVGWCKNCAKAEAKFCPGGGRLLIKKSTAVADGPQIYPAFRFRDGQGRSRFPANRKGDYRQPRDLDDLLDIIERNYGSNAVGAASGSMGSVNIRPQVEQGLAYFASNVRGPIVCIWDSNRNNGTGAKDGFNILHAKASDWTCDRIYGTFGSFSIRCDAGIQVGDQLFKQLDITYKAEGDELKVLTSFGIKKAALEPHSESFAVSAQPCGIDPATALTIFSVLQAIWSAAHPELDLQLPGRIQATIDVKDSAFLIDFDGAPRIRAKMYWEWMLEMDWVSVSTTKAHVEFVDQKDYWIKVKSRELAVN